MDRHLGTETFKSGRRRDRWRHSVSPLSVHPTRKTRRDHSWRIPSDGRGDMASSPTRRSDTRTESLALRHSHYDNEAPHVHASSADRHRDRIRDRPRVRCVRRLLHRTGNTGASEEKGEAMSNTGCLNDRSERGDHSVRPQSLRFEDIKEQIRRRDIVSSDCEYGRSH